MARNRTLAVHCVSGGHRVRGKQVAWDGVRWLSTVTIGQDVTLRCTRAMFWLWVLRVLHLVWPGLNQAMPQTEKGGYQWGWRPGSKRPDNPGPYKQIIQDQREQGTRNYKEMRGRGSQGTMSRRQPWLYSVCPSVCQSNQHSDGGELARTGRAKEKCLSLSHRTFDVSYPAS